MKKKELVYEERYCIEKLLKQDKSYQEIADALNRGKSTIGEEVKRNGGRTHYSAKKAQHRAYLRRWRAKRGCNKVALSREMSSYVEQKLLLLWSPERIAGAMQRNIGLYASAKSIRKFIIKRPSLERFLFWNRVHKKSGPKRAKGAHLSDRTFINERPAITTAGHFEGDFIVSTHNTTVLLVLVDIVTRVTLMRFLPNRNNDLVNEAIVSMLEPYTVQSLTLDNDIAFQKHRLLETMLQAPIYFTHPYCSWEKGLVENTNRWIRSFIPKKTDLRLVTIDEIQTIEYWFNTTPRQCLNFFSSSDLSPYYATIPSLSISSVLGGR